MEEKMGAVIGGKRLNRLGSKPGRFKRMVARHLGKKAAEKIQSSDGARLVAKGKRTGNKELVRTGGFIRNMFDDVNLEEKMDSEAQKSYNTPAAVHKAEKTYPRFAALTDLDLNTKNRNETIKEYSYGPANPANEEGSKLFWERKADLWNAPIEQVKSMRCNNCNAFNKTPEVKKKMADALGPKGRTIIEKSELGYCEFFEFKCAGSRSCDAWVGGGPITETTVEGKGLYHNIHMKRKRGEKMRKAGEKGAPKPSDFKRAATTAREEIGFPDDGFGTTKSKKKLQKMTPGEKEMKEASSTKMSKLRQLSKSGLVSKKDINKFDTLMRKVERAGGDMSKLTNQERSFLAGMYDDLISTIVNDPTIFTRMRRKGTQNESVQEASNNPQRDHKASENNERAQLPGAKTQMQKKRILDRIEYHKKMQNKNEDSHTDGSYSKKKLKMAADAATELDGMLGDNDDLPEWVQGKITKAADYLDSARDYMKNRGDNGMAPASESLKVFRVSSSKLNGNVRAKDEKEAEKIFRKKGVRGKLTIVDRGPVRHYRRVKNDYDLIKEETEIGGKTFDDLELCPMAVKAFKKDIVNAKDKQAVLNAAQAVDNYLAIERKGLEGKVTDEDMEKMKKLVAVAKKKISDAGLSASDHDYHQSHIDTLAKLIKKSMNESMYKSPGHARLQRFMNKNRQTAAYKNRVRQLGGTPLKPGEQNPMRRTTEKVDMKKADMGDVIRDFEKSDAPQFKGKSKSKRREMAIAAKLANEEDKTFKGKDYKVTLEKGRNYTLKGVHQATYKENPSLSKERAHQVAKQIHKSLSESKDLCCDDCNDHFDHVIEESEYKGKKVKLNDPIRTSEVPSKKFKVYVKDPATGNIKVVRFGDPNLSIKRDDPARRKSFRARHNCDNPGPKTKARYWSCYQWRASQKVDN